MSENISNNDLNTEICKERVKVCFIILHYMDVNLTQKCVESILNLDNSEDSKIVIVDNASPNNSGKELAEYYSEKSSVKMIISDVNLGFSVGNNLGYQYVCTHFEPDFVIAANNDVIFHQKDFIYKLYEEHRKHSFYIAGPDIYIPHRRWHQSPIATVLQTPDMVQNEISKLDALDKEYRKTVSISGMKLFLREKATTNCILRWLVKIIRVKNKCNVKWETEANNCVLQGSCLIFSKTFCEKSQVLFEPYTFMYCEELFLSLKCYLMQWNTIYIPNIQILHLNQGSTISRNVSYREMCDKKIISDEKCKSSYKKYIEVYTAKMDRKKERMFN